MYTKFNTGNPDPITTTILDRISHVLNNEADRLIDEKTDQFRRELISRRDIVIAEIISCIEIQTMTNDIDNDINFNIRLKPSKFIK